MFRYLNPREGTETENNQVAEWEGDLFRYLNPREGTETRAFADSAIKPALVQIP